MAGSSAIFGLIATPLLGLLKSDARKAITKHGASAVRLAQQYFGLIDQNAIDIANAEEGLEEAKEALQRADEKLIAAQERLDTLDEQHEHSSAMSSFPCVGYLFATATEASDEARSNAKTLLEKAKEKKESTKIERDQAEIILDALRLGESLEEAHNKINNMSSRRESILGMINIEQHIDRGDSTRVEDLKGRLHVQLKETQETLRNLASRKAAAKEIIDNLGKRTTELNNILKVCNSAEQVNEIQSLLRREDAFLRAKGALPNELLFQIEEAERSLLETKLQIENNLKYLESDDVCEIQEVEARINEQIQISKDEFKAVIILVNKVKKLDIYNLLERLVKFNYIKNELLAQALKEIQAEIERNSNPEIVEIYHEMIQAKEARDRLKEYKVEIQKLYESSATSSADTSEQRILELKRLIQQEKNHPSIKGLISKFLLIRNLNMIQEFIDKLNETAEDNKGVISELLKIQQNIANSKDILSNLQKFKSIKDELLEVEERNSQLQFQENQRLEKIALLHSQVQELIDGLEANHKLIPRLNALKSSVDVEAGLAVVDFVKQQLQEERREKQSNLAISVSASNNGATSNHDSDTVSPREFSIISAITNFLAGNMGYDEYDVYYISDVVYDDPELVQSITNQEKYIANKESELALNDLSLNVLLEMFFEDRIIDQVNEGSFDRTDNYSTLVTSVENIIGQNALNEFEGFYKYLSIPGSYNFITNIVNSIARLASDLNSLLDMNSYTEYPVISDQIMIAFTRIEHLMAFIESGPMTVGIAPRPYHFDPPSDPFGVGDSVCWDGSAPHSDKEQQLVYVGDSNFTINNAVEVF